MVITCKVCAITVLAPVSARVPCDKCDFMSQHDISTRQTKLLFHPYLFVVKTTKPLMSSTMAPAAASDEWNSSSCVPADGAGSCRPAAKAGSCRVYRRRWLMLLLFCLYSMFNAFQWIQYATVNNIVARYWSLSATQIDWLSMVYMVVYVPFIFPATWLVDKKGLRVPVLLGSFGTMVAAWIKVASLSPDRFYATFIGQTLAALAQVFVLGIPAKLAAVWFGRDQVSSACAMGVFGNQIGNALGFLIPPAIVHDSEDLQQIGHQLAIIFYGQAVLNTVLFVSIFFLFQDRPPLPPSPGQAALLLLAAPPSPALSEPAASKTTPPPAAVAAAAAGEGYVASLRRLAAQSGFVLQTITYGINVGAFYAISTLLAQLVLVHFQNSNADAGRIGLLLVVTGLVGSVLCGVWLDKTHQFKRTALLVYVLSAVSQFVFAFTLPLGHISIVYITAALLGFFMTGYLPLGFEFAAEITYPEPEATTSGLLNASAQIFGIVLTLAGGSLLDRYNDIAANLTIACFLVLGAILTGFIREDLRRQRGHCIATDDVTTASQP